MHVQYWGVGVNTMRPLQMSSANISAYLMDDWVPSIPIALSSSFMGWPPVLIEETTIDVLRYLSLRSELGRTERQWKSFLSWMLGIAGTRHVLGLEGYRWIAPASAFYSDAVYPVDLSQWHPSFPPSCVTVELPPNPKSRLRPDYLAIRSIGGKFDWAIAESKGTSQCLTNMSSCPRDWRNQANNAVVRVNGRTLKIPRHIVVATRSNPNAIFAKTRRLQVRAWNSTFESSEPGLSQLVTETVSAHLFGLFRNMGLPENARAISYSVRARAESNIGGAIRSSWNQTLDQLRERADSELKQVTVPHPDAQDSRMRQIDTGLGRVSIEISEATISLASKLILSDTEDESISAITEANSQLEDWEGSQTKIDDDETLLPSGVRVRFSYRPTIQ